MTDARIHQNPRLTVVAQNVSLQVTQNAKLAVVSQNVSIQAAQVVRLTILSPAVVGANQEMSTSILW